MHRHVFAGLLALLLLVSAGGADASDSLRIGNRLLMKGDSAATVITLLGKPSHTLHRGGAGARRRGKRTHGRSDAATASERWQYRREGRVVVVTLVDGRVADIDERSS